MTILPIYKDPNYERALSDALEDLGISKEDSENLPKLIELFCRLKADVTRQEFIILSLSKRLNKLEEDK